MWLTPFNLDGHLDKLYLNLPSPRPLGTYFNPSHQTKSIGHRPPKKRQFEACDVSLLLGQTIVGKGSIATHCVDINLGRAREGGSGI